MVKIKANLFEGIVACTILPSIGFIFTTLILLISIFNVQIERVYVGIGISYAICAAILGGSIIICFAINRKSKNEMIIDDDKIILQGKIHEIAQIEVCEYYLCKWYCIPAAYFYKQQLAGLFYVKFQNGEKIKIHVLYSDFLKINKTIKQISIK